MWVVWATAFVRALFQAIACPTGEGPFEVVHYESRARHHAAFLRALFEGSAHRWEFAEFSKSEIFKAPGRVFDSFATGAELRELLIALDAERVLNPLLLRLDDLALEQLFIRLAR